MIVVIGLHIWVPRRNIVILSEHPGIRVRNSHGSGFSLNTQRSTGQASVGRKIRKNVGLVLKAPGDLVIDDTEKAGKQMLHFP